MRVFRWLSDKVKLPPRKYVCIASKRLDQVNVDSDDTIDREWGQLLSDEPGKIGVGDLLTLAI